MSLLMYDGRRVRLQLVGCSEQLAVGIGRAVLDGQASPVERTSAAMAVSQRGGPHQVDPFIDVDPGHDR